MTEHGKPAGSIRPGFAEADWNERYAGRELVWTADPNRLFAAEVADLPAGRALDLACGEGRNAVWLAERGWRVTAVDFAAVGLAKARELAASRDVEVEWVHADLLEYAPEPGRSTSSRSSTSSSRATSSTSCFVARLPRSRAAGRSSCSGTTRRTSPTDTAARRTSRCSSRPEDVVAALGDLVVERAEKIRRTVSLDGGDATAIDAFVRAHRPKAGQALRPR